MNHRNPIGEETLVIIHHDSNKGKQNTHDIWAAGRLRDGWQYGPERNDTKKTNPTLVPYDQLPESEKQYDRNTALETLKVILKLGFQIIPAEK